jgi:hypothetical protein
MAAVTAALTGKSYDGLMERAADAPGSTLGQRLYVARQRAMLCAAETANGAGLHANLLLAVEAEEPTTDNVPAKIKDLIAALGG